MVADDDVDLESLQAQIDISMSFAHNLVESWIKPIHRARLGSSSTNVSQILEEDLHRPPRLGVGASIPVTPLLAHEASKLKRRLGKHAAKNEGVMGSQAQESEDEEHKGRPSKRKVKVDPFANTGSKKRRVEPRSNSCASAEDVSKNPVVLPKNSYGMEPKNHSSSSRKEKQQTVRSPQTTSSADLTIPVAPCSELSRETSAPDPGKVTPESSRVRASSIPSNDKAKPLGVPLLNLDGPPEVPDTPGHARELNDSRRKRKRRKKKKPPKNMNSQDNAQ